LDTGNYDPVSTRPGIIMVMRLCRMLVNIDLIISFMKGFRNYRGSTKEKEKRLTTKEQRNEEHEEEKKKKRKRKKGPLKHNIQVL
jgi:choline-glycine betaine transporter